MSAIIQVNKQLASAVPASGQSGFGMKSIRAMPLCEFPPPWMSFRILFSSIVFLVFTGCGYDSYESRLQQTRDYYKYFEKVEANLGPKWRDGLGALEIRVPKQFMPIPAPQPLTREDGTIEPLSLDLRQPDYVNLIIPGLLGAWEATFEVPLDDKLNSSTTKNASELRKAYIYAASNYRMFIESPNDVSQFIQSLTDLVGTALGGKVKTEPPEMYPKPGNFTPPASFNVFRYNQKAITQQTSNRRTTVNYTFEIYTPQTGDMKCAIVIALPEGIDSREKINERVSLMLEHVRPAQTPPRQETFSSPTGPTNPASTGF